MKRGPGLAVIWGDGANRYPKEGRGSKKGLGDCVGKRSGLEAKIYKRGCMLPVSKFFRGEENRPSPGFGT